MTTNERASYIYEKLIAAGMTRAGAIGTIGNLQGESSTFNPQACETSYLKKFGLTTEEYVRRADNNEIIYNGKLFIKDSAGFGIVQWTYWARKQNLLNYARAQNKSVGDLDVQIAFMIKEMTESYPNTWKICSTTNSYKEAVKICVTNYEKPAKQTEAIAKRTEYAKAWDAILGKGAKEEATPVVQEKEKTSGFDRKKVVSIAINELGYREKRTNEQLDEKTANAGTNNYTKYAKYLDSLNGFYNGKKNGYAWCDIFVDWCFVQAFGEENALALLCQTRGGSGAGCTYSMGYFRNKKQFIRRSEGKPQVGDQIFFGTGLDNSTHTGLVVAVDDSKVHTIEGNTNDNPTVVAEGIGVYQKTYALSKTSIIGYGRPNFNDGYTGNGLELLNSESEKEETTKEAKVEEPAKEETKIEETKVEEPKNEEVSTNGVYDRRKFIDVAMSQIGYLEKKSNKNLDDFTANAGEGDFTKYARDLDAITDFYYHDSKQGFAWCDVFVDWCFVQAFGFEGALAVNCQPKKSYGAGCDMSAKYYKQAGRLDNTPQVGDQFFINNWTHTGIVTEVRSNSVVTIEGNQNVSNDQQGVVQKVRLCSEIDGFGHPNYNDGLTGKFYWNKDRTDLKQTGKIEGKTETPKVEEKTETPKVEVKEETSVFTPPTLQKGSKGKSVKKLQALLVYSGYGIGVSGVDGDFGSATDTAVKKVQRAMGIAQTGIANDAIWAYLINT